MIRFEGTSFRYHPASRWVIDNLDLEIEEGELAVVVGSTGAGKTTLLRLIDGLIPHFSGGELKGDVLVDGHSIRESSPTELAGIVGFVGQDPSASFVTDRVEDEIAYAMENLGVGPTAMRRRVEDALDVMSLHELRDRPLRTLSGGQRQRVAIAAVLAASPRLLVLDEPTSALDPGAAEEVLSALTRLVHDVGMTVVVAEHRLERVLPFADRVLLLGDDGSLRSGAPGEMLDGSPLAPPLVDLGRLAGWSPLPVTVREARRQSANLLAILGTRQPPAASISGGDPIAQVVDARVAYGPLRAIDGLSTTISSGTITALMGRNGSGKSTLLAALAGMRSVERGRVSIAGHDPVLLTAAERIRLVGLVPQDPGLLLYAQSVVGECEMADSEHALDPGSTRHCLEQLLGAVEGDRHPRDLSEGQRLSLALAVVLAPRPSLLLLDEPTRGLDYEAKRALCRQLASLRDEGVAVLLATHDVELVASVADRAIVLAGGEIIAEGPSRDVVCHTPAFAPQVAKVLSPSVWLTVAEIEEALCAP